MKDYKPLILAILLLASTTHAAPAPAAALSKEDVAFLEDLSKREFLFFWEQADSAPGLSARFTTR